jgi:hypothetical protein
MRHPHAALGCHDNGRASMHLPGLYVEGLCSEGALLADGLLVVVLGNVERVAVVRSNPARECGNVICIELSFGGLAECVPEGVPFGAGLPGENTLGKCA